MLRAATAWENSDAKVDPPQEYRWKRFAKLTLRRVFHRFPRIKSLTEWDLSV